MIEARNLSKAFHDRRAVDDVSFEIARGTVVGFLGPNGAGKSTTMRLLTGYLRPDGGEARIAGHDVGTETARARASLGYLPEAAAGFPNLTVREFLTWCAECRGLWGAARDAAIERASQETDLGPALSLRMRTLSKGWRQRAWFAQAILHDPPVLIFDEPTDGLDPNQKAHIRDFIRAIAPRKAIILSTHILEEAEEICDRVIIIANGRIVADEACKTLADRKGRLWAAFRRLTDPDAAVPAGLIRRMRERPEHPRTPSAAGAVLAVFRHEWRQLVHSPLTTIFQIGFLVALAACTFLIADFYATDEASIGPMLIFLPWVSLILVPALAMRAWVDEPGDRGMELALTLPIPVWTVAAGKFLAGGAVLLITLAFTAPFAATVFYLGEPDAGVMLAGYLGAALLVLAFYAVALFAAALMREPVGAFVVGVVVLFFLLLLGWDVFGRLLRDQIPAPLYGALTAFSPKFWLDRMGKGQVELAGIVYFAGLSMVALLGTTLLGRPRRRSGAGLARGALLAAAIAAALGVVVTMAREIPLALDLTAEKEFTLHQGTLTVLERLPEGVEIDLYWSESEPAVPASIKSHARRVRDHLRTIAARSGGRVTVRERDPKPDSEDELRALGAGLRRIPMTSGDSFFLGAGFRHKKRLGRIPYFDIRRDRLVDYDVALALNGLTKTRTPKVGILSPLLQSRHATETRRVSRSSASSGRPTTWR